MRRNRLGIPILAGLVVAVVLVTVFVLDPFGDKVRAAVDGNNYHQEAASIDLDALPEWMKIELIDAATDEVFRIADFVGRPILVESFAVWCSICLRQQKEMAKLVESHGEAIVHVSLDTDPNEDRSLVREHALRHGFDWLFAVAPIELTQALIDAFGLTVVNAPRAPVVLIESDGSARLLENGVKSAERLAEIVGLEPNPAETVDG